MISYAEFAVLRLKDFVDVSITRLEGWEFMEDSWVGEATGFSEWLRLQSDPATLRSLSVAFEEFPAEPAARVMEALGLPLRAGMSFEQMLQVLGDPLKVAQFVPDRKTYEFVTNGESPFNVSCTVRSDTGLSYIVVSRPPDT